MDINHLSSFVSRHIGLSDQEQQTMLATLGFASLEALIAETLPADLVEDNNWHLPEYSEAAMLDKLKTLAKQNQCTQTLIGQGYYGTFMPAAIQRNLFENPAWYTAYTPYQAEISQGRMEMLFAYQTLVSDLTGLEIANASLLDEGTAVAEAILMSRRVNKKTDGHVLFVGSMFKQTMAVVTTRLKALSIAWHGVATIDDLSAEQLAGAFAVVVQYPDARGEVTAHHALAEKIKQHNAHFIVAADLLALCLLKPPGEWGADIAVGSSQRFGVPLGFGGPHAAWIACKSNFRRQLPGRIVGLSRDCHGQNAYRLALQTREQHIRRETATSNICTAQVLLAVCAAAFALWHGPEGLKAIAQSCHNYARKLSKQLQRWQQQTNTYCFDTVSWQAGARASAVVDACRAQGIELFAGADGWLSVSFDETCDDAVFAKLIDALATVYGSRADVLELTEPPTDLLRQSTFLNAPVFSNYRSETAFMRYITRLAQADLALDRTMIPLGSCTMKLNAAAEMMPVSWPEFANIHPLAPAEHWQGWQAIFTSLQDILAQLTGFDAVSLQPNSGAQGEYAGLMAIRTWLNANNQNERNVCLIPSSSHGTNPASATIAGFKTVMVRCNKAGNVDVDHLAELLQQHHTTVGAFMITYPSTHGVYETTIKQMCQMVHDAGGQVYLDGANLNALVGLAQPGRFGADVCHINLHKTFCIPHGGGGPGAGPIAVGAHLAPYLPADPMTASDDDVVISAARFGSAGILPISWAYVHLLGSAGLRRATQVAILSANYLAKRLGDAYPILYTGEKGYIAHECILDIRPITENTGISAEDIAKRLVDYGFHAPTMSFPVAGTLMIEPTESEPKAELERFIDAMLAIRQEIVAVADGTMPRDNNVLVNAPHTAAVVTADSWDKPYSRQLAAWPLAQSGNTQKYWAPVGRVDNVFGDRNLVNKFT